MDTQEIEPVAEAVGPPKAIRPLEYDTRTALVTRRQMRFFLLLLLINTFLFAIFVCMPTVSPFLKKMLEDYQARREQERITAARDAEDKSDAAKHQAMIDACMSYTAPADQIIYTESESDVSKLLASAGRAYLLSAGLKTSNRELSKSTWQPPAARAFFEPLFSLLDAHSGAGPGRGISGPSPEENAVFLHQLNTPAGAKRLVWVSVDVATELIADAGRPLVDAPHNGEIGRWNIVIHRQFVACVFDPNFSNPLSTTAIIQISPADHTTFIFEEDQSGVITRSELRPVGQWRIYAGQPDPNNPSHLTIAYDIDGKPGIIDGWLKDGDRLMLEPRVGRLTGWNSGSEYVWDMTAGAAATKPVK